MEPAVAWAAACTCEQTGKGCTRWDIDRVRCGSSAAPACTCWLPVSQHAAVPCPPADSLNSKSPRAQAKLQGLFTYAQAGVREWRG